LSHRFREIDFSNKRKIADGPKETPNDQRKIKQHAQPIGPIGSVAYLGDKPTNEYQAQNHIQTNGEAHSIQTNG